MHRLIDALWLREREGLLARALLFPLWLVSLAVGLVARRRRRVARLGAGSRPTARVISVGNLAVGGAGKTPVAIFLARRLFDAGAQPAVLSRGYGRSSNAPLVVASDGERLLATAAEAGDEPLLAARSCPGVPVLVAPDRALAAREAVSRFGARTLVLDDGFQHHALARDLDVVVLDASCPFGNGHLLPRGPLREPRSALGAADLLWLSKVDQAPAGRADALARELVAAHGRPVVQSAYRPAAVVDAAFGNPRPPSALSGNPVLLLAGIARPASFERTLEGMGARVVGRALFKDHHTFTPAELERIEAQARALGALWIVLTEKDAVRLPPSCAGGPFAVVRIDVEIRAGAEHLDRLLGTS